MRSIGRQIVHPGDGARPRRKQHAYQITVTRGGLRRLLYVLASFFLLTAVWGCATSHPPDPAARRFDFQKDTFAYANGLVWEYGYDTNGVWRARKRVPEPDYTLHCFVVARSAKQFFANARFDPQQPAVDEDAYRRLIRRVVSSNPRSKLPQAKRIVIPGYADLRSFSAAQEKLLKEECGSTWQSYFQRGHWRMVFPFTRHQQEKAVTRMLAHLRERGPVVAHVYCFPELSINHAVVVFDARETPEEIQFRIYDPNDAEKPGAMIFDREKRSLVLPANAYFPGGQVNVYEIYWNWDY